MKNANIQMFLDELELTEKFEFNEEGDAIVIDSIYTVDFQKMITLINAFEETKGISLGLIFSKSSGKLIIWECKKKL